MLFKFRTSLLCLVAVPLVVANVALGQQTEVRSSKTAKKIVQAASTSVGKKMWNKGYGLRSGGLGCAASVSNVLNLAGIDYVHSAATKYMRGQILKGKGKVQEFVIKSGGDAPIDDRRLSKVARPGDVLVAFMNPLPQGNIGPKAHCGIIGSPGKVYTNDWNDGIWKHGNIHRYFDSYRHIRVIRFL